MKAYQSLPLRENLRFSWKRYRVWWVILLVTMVFDFLTTAQFVSRYGIHAEANLVTRWLMSVLGTVPGNALGKLLQLVAVIGFVSLSRRLGNLVMLLVILLNCWAVVINSW